MFNINLVRLKPRNCISFALLRMTKERNRIIGDKRIKDRAAPERAALFTRLRRYLQID